MIVAPEFINSSSALPSNIESYLEYSSSTEGLRPPLYSLGLSSNVGLIIVIPIVDLNDVYHLDAD